MFLELFLYGARVCYYILFPRNGSPLTFSQKKLSPSEGLGWEAVTSFSLSTFMSKSYVSNLC